MVAVFLETMVQPDLGFGSHTKVLVGDGFCAVGAEPAGPDAPAEQVAFLASAGPEVSGGTVWALIDGGVGPRGHRFGRAGRRGVTSPVAGLAAGVAVEAAPA